MTTIISKPSRMILNFFFILVVLSMGLGSSPEAARAAAPSRILWHTFAGSDGDDHAVATAMDGSGNLYVAGTTNSGFGTPVRSFMGFTDCFVVKLDPNGALLWNTYLGTNNEDMCTGLVVDSAGNAYLTGNSYDTWGNPVDPIDPGVFNDAFVAKLDPSGNLAWNTFLGGSGYDEGKGLALYGNGLYVTGFSASAWGTPVFEFDAGNEAFAMKLDASNGTLLWMTFMGGVGIDQGDDITVGSNGSIFVAGRSDGDWGQPVEDYTDGDIFLARLGAEGQLIWNTFLGAEGHADVVSPEITADGSSNAYVLGQSDATWGNPVAPYSFGVDSFVARLDPQGYMLWNSFLGGGGTDGPKDISLADGAVFVSGHSNATWGNPMAPWTGGVDSFAAKMNPNGQLILNLFIGGNGDDVAHAHVMVNPTTMIFAGHSNTTWGTPIVAKRMGWDPFVTKVNLAGSFSDVPETHWGFSWIERLYNAGITSGCGGAPLRYCPQGSVTRAEMAIFIERGINGAAYDPPDNVGAIFTDVPVSYWAIDWIHKLYADGITTGCSIHPPKYCPDSPVTRAQMAVFLLRARHGNTFVPPPAVGLFSDVPTSYWAAAWIERLATEGITTGCGGGKYCPENAVTRAEMAVFLIRAFWLP